MLLNVIGRLYGNIVRLPISMIQIRGKRTGIISAFSINPSTRLNNLTKRVRILEEKMDVQQELIYELRRHIESLMDHGSNSGIYMNTLMERLIRLEHRLENHKNKPQHHKNKPQHNSDVLVEIDRLKKLLYEVRENLKGFGMYIEQNPHIQKHLDNLDKAAELLNSYEGSPSTKFEHPTLVQRLKYIEFLINGRDTDGTAV